MYIYIYILESARALSRALDSSGYPKVLDYKDFVQATIVADGGVHALVLRVDRLVCLLTEEQTHIQTCRHNDKGTKKDRQPARQTDRQASKQIDRQTDRRTNGQTYSDTDKDKHIDRKTDRQTGKQTNTYRQRQTRTD